jgi:VWFA-related protein
VKTAGAALLVLVATVTALAAQGPPPAAPQGPPTFRGSVEITRIDVSVLDANRRPVRGLKLEDFELYEDGVLQRLQAVSEINIPDAEEGAAWIRNVAPDVRSNSAEDGRVLVFLLDEALSPTGLQTPIMIETVRRIGNEVIDGMGPNDVAAVLFTWDNKRQAQDFTTDRARLRAAMDRYRPRNFPLSGPYSWLQVSAGVARSVLKHLIELPGRRKALIYVSPNLFLRPARFMTAHMEVEDLYVIGTFEEAMKAGVTVYTISPTGLRTLGGGDAPRSRSGAAGPSAAPESTTPRPLTSPPTSLSAETGGFAITSPAQFKEGVAQILRETGSYYVLGYVSPAERPVEDHNAVRGYRQIDVRVKREGLTVRGRTGFVPTTPPPPPKKPVSLLSEALAGVLPKDDLPLRLTAVPFALPGRSEAVALMVLNVEEPAPADRTTDRVDMQARAFTHHGDPRGMMQQGLDVTLPGGREGTLQFELLSMLPVKPGRLELRVSARSRRLDVEGSVYAGLDVPDFAKAPLSMSGLVLSATPAWPTAPHDAFSGILPVVPTTRRVFEATDRVSGFVRVYQTGRKSAMPVTLTWRIVDRVGTVIVERTERMDAERFGVARAADVVLPLPLGALSAGSHLLQVAAAAGEDSAARDLRFGVR